jgi:hypothetical protein
MLKIEQKLSRDSGLLSILKDGVFGDQIMNYMKDKVKLAILLVT